VIASRIHGAAVALVDDMHHPEFAELTADFVYLRLRRCAEDEPAGYNPDALDRWVECLRGGRRRAATVSSTSSTAPRFAPAAAQALIARL
jgi:uncharacterized protein YecE (DUF72 family)